MNKYFSILIAYLIPLFLSGQDLSEGLIVNDLSLRPMEEIDKPEYLNSIVDPSFGTTIRRISNASQGEVIVPMYSTIQAWNADETYMILYNQSTGNHELLDGMSYEPLRALTDIDPIDLEQIFWDFNDPDILYYPDRQSSNFVRYTVSVQSKQTIVNLAELSECASSVEMGNDIQMMSWDSDVFTFRCGNLKSYAYRISTGELTEFNMAAVDYASPAASPSGNRFYHLNEVYNSSGNSTVELNKNSVEHSCTGRLPNGTDAYYAIAFEEGPDGGCMGDIIAHDLTTGECFPVISQSQGYGYPQSGTHISALAHKNTQGGWIAASMIGYDRNGQELLDQELVMARAEAGNIQVCRIGHHRSDEEEFDYWGEPHAVISPSGTRVLFASDWSGEEDGQSIDSYVVELPVYLNTVSTTDFSFQSLAHKILPNPAAHSMKLSLKNIDNRDFKLCIYNCNGENIITDHFDTNEYILATTDLIPGIYFIQVTDDGSIVIASKFIKE